MAVVRPFRALRYDPAVGGPLESLVAPPYDVIGSEQREELQGQSPYNVVHLTLPDSEEEAAASLAEWQEQGVWRRLHEVLLAKLHAADRIDWSRAVIDSSHVRAVGGASRPVHAL